MVRKSNKTNKLKKQTQNESQLELKEIHPPDPNGTTAVTWTVIMVNFIAGVATLILFGLLITIVNGKCDSYSNSWAYYCKEVSLEEAHLLMFACVFGLLNNILNIASGIANVIGTDFKKRGRPLLAWAILSTTCLTVTFLYFTLCAPLLITTTSLLISLAVISARFVDFYKYMHTKGWIPRFSNLDWRKYVPNISNFPKFRFGYEKKTFPKKWAHRFNNRNVRRKVKSQSNFSKGFYIFNFSILVCYGFMV